MWFPLGRLPCSALRRLVAPPVHTPRLVVASPVAVVAVEVASEATWGRKRGHGWLDLHDMKPMGANRWETLGAKRLPYLRRSHGFLHLCCGSRDCRRSCWSRRRSRWSRRRTDGSPFHQKHRRTWTKRSTLGLDRFATKGLRKREVGNHWSGSETLTSRRDRQYSAYDTTYHDIQSTILYMSRY